MPTSSGLGIHIRNARACAEYAKICISPEGHPKGIENHIPFVNRLVGWWRRMQQDRFLDKATPEQGEALKRDLEPVISIYDQL